MAVNVTVSGVPVIEVVSGESVPTGDSTAVVGITVPGVPVTIGVGETSGVSVGGGGYVAVGRINWVGVGGSVAVGLRGARVGVGSIVGVTVLVFVGSGVSVGSATRLGAYTSAVSPSAYIDSSPRNVTSKTALNALSQIQYASH